MPNDSKLAYSLEPPHRRSIGRLRTYFQTSLVFFYSPGTTSDSRSFGGKRNGPMIDQSGGLWMVLLLTGSFAAGDKYFTERERVSVCSSWKIVRNYRPGSMLPASSAGCKLCTSERLFLVHNSSHLHRRRRLHHPSGKRLTILSGFGW